MERMTVETGAPNGRTEQMRGAVLARVAAEMEPPLSESDIRARLWYLRTLSGPSCPVTIKAT